MNHNPGFDINNIPNNPQWHKGTQIDPFVDSDMEPIINQYQNMAIDSNCIKHQDMPLDHTVIGRCQYGHIGPYKQKCPRCAFKIKWKGMSLDYDLSCPEHIDASGNRYKCGPYCSNEWV